MRTFIPLTERRLSPEQKQIEHVNQIGRQMIARFADNPDRAITMVFIRTNPKKQMNQGIVMVYDWESWTTGTLKHRGYLNPKNVSYRRPAHPAERREISEMIRARTRIYKTWDELEEDERRVGTSEEIIVQMRRTISPTEEDHNHRRREFMAQFPPVETTPDPFAVEDEEDHTPLDSEICNVCGRLLDDEGACESCADALSESDED